MKFPAVIGVCLMIFNRCAEGKYQPRALTKEQCENMTDDECERRDRDLMGQNQQRKLVVNSQGFLNILVIPLKWKDTPASRTLPTVETLNELWNGVGVSDNIPSGSIANYTHVNSHGNLKLNATVVDWIEADNTEIYYAAGRSGAPNGNAPGTVQLEDVVFYALQQLANTGFDFTPFDQNNDVIIDAVSVLHSGYASEMGVTDCSNGRGQLDRIHSQEDVAAVPRYFGPYGYMLGSYTIASAFDGSCHSKLAGIGIITHEFIHLFGMPELYDVAGPYTNSGCCVGGLGAYDIM